MTTKNFWGDRIHFFCNNGHTYTEKDGRVVNDPIDFVEQRGNSVFYACPKYFKLDEEHPTGYYDDEKQCTNNLGFADAEKIVAHLENQYEQETENGEVVDLTNFSFSIGQIDVTVLLHDADDQLYLGIVNKRAIYK